MESEHNIPILISQFITTEASDGSGENESSKFSLELAQLIQSNKLTLLQFIQNLGPSLTSDSDVVRCKSLACLSSTLNHLIVGGTTNKLSKQDIMVLMEFLLNKFDDKVCLQDVLITINYLIQFNNFLPSLVSEKLLTSLNDSYNPKQYLAKIRYQAFEIMANLLTFHLKYYSDSGKNSNLFIKTFISIADGEKDPRNLLSSFDINTRINTNFQFDQSSDLHKQYLNDLFDICFCYFPISFTPPSNDPYKITSKQLKTKLINTIASQSLFTPDSFNNLIEKLTSTNPMVRNDVLHTLLACVEQYDVATVETYWLMIWNSIKFELVHRNDLSSVFKPDSLELIPENYQDINDNDENKSLILALIIIQTLNRRLINQDFYSQFLSTIFDELKENFVKINDKSKPSILILSVIASQSQESFNFVIDQLFDYDIWGKYINVEPKQRKALELESNMNEDFTLDIEKQRSLIDLLGFIFTSYYLRSGDDEQFRQENSLIEYKSHLLIFMGQLFNSSTNMEIPLKVKIIQQFIKLIQLEKFLNSSEFDLIFQYFTDIISNENINWSDPIVNELVSGLVLISEFKPNLVIDNILPQLLHIAQQSTTSEGITQVLNVIGDICTSYQFLEVLSIRFISILQNTSNKELIQLVVEMFIKLIKKIETRNQFLTNSWLNKFVPTIIGLHQQDPILVERIGDLVGLLIRFCDASKHQSIVDQYTKEFAHTLETPSVEMAIYSKIIANCDRSVKYQDFSLANYIKLIKTIDNKYLHVIYLQFLTLSVNKFLNCDNDLDGLFTAGQSTSLDLEIFMWTLKGLLLKLNKLGLEYLHKVMTLFISTDNYQLKSWISQSLMVLFVDIAIFVNPIPQIKKRDLISKVNSYNVQLLYKQHIFELVLPELIRGNDKVLLQSLSLILNNLGNESIVKPHLQEILPSMLTSLGVEDAMMISSSLSTLTIIIDQDVMLISSDLIPIIERLQILISDKIIKNHKQINDEAIRLKSLQILTSLFDNYKVKDQLVPYKKQCLVKLSPGLDDAKRSVRKACADLCQVLYEL